jgi:hypothetical protein
MKILTQWFEDVWNRRDLGAFHRLLSPSAVLHGIYDTDGVPVHDAEGCKKMLLSFPDGVVSNMHHEVQFEITEGDMSAARCIVTALHINKDMGESVVVTPIRVTGICMARIKRGQITELWSHFDIESAYQQLEGGGSQTASISSPESGSEAL